MVQLHDFQRYRNEQRHYWKIDSGLHKKTKGLLNYLQSKHYTCKSRGLVRLRELYVCCQRGLLSYEGLSVAELKLFISRRGLPTIIDQKPTKSMLKAHLEQADDEATFDRFSELPPEIRHQIFTHYFHSFNRLTIGCTAAVPQPPITYASRQVRDEALPLFYSNACFYLPFWTCSPELQSERFVHTTLTQYFARAQFLKLNFGKWDAFADDNWVISVSIRVEDHKCSAKVTRFQIRTGVEGPTATLQELNRTFMEEQRCFTHGLAACEGPEELRTEEFHMLLHGLEDLIQDSLSASWRREMAERN